MFSPEGDQEKAHKENKEVGHHEEPDGRENQQVNDEIEVNEQQHDSGEQQSKKMAEGKTTEEITTEHLDHLNLTPEVKAGLASFQKFMNAEAERMFQKAGLRAGPAQHRAPWSEDMERLIAQRDQQRGDAPEGPRKKTPEVKPIISPWV